MFMRAVVSSSLVLFVGQCFAQQAPKLLRRDALIETIMVPSDDPRFAAFNPAVQQPRVIIRNAGTDPLEGISIRYGTDGFLPRMFAWTGHLGSGASAEVVLPHLIDMRPGTNTFTVVLGSPNGRKDKNKANNTLSTTFTAADAYGEEITMRLSMPQGNGGSLRLENTRGPIPLEWSWKAGADSVRRETLHLANGSYSLTVADSGRGPNARVLITDEAGLPIKVLFSKPRSGTVHQFRVDATAPTVKPMELAANVNVRHGQSSADVEVLSLAEGDVLLRNAGGTDVATWHVAAGEEWMRRIDGSTYGTGSYKLLFRSLGKDTELGTIQVP